MHGNLNLNVNIEDFKSLSYKSATIDQSYYKDYISAGHLEDAMILYNYFEPSPMPDCIDDIKRHFSFLSPISVAVNLCKPGQYLPLHSDLYKRWMLVHSINNINNIFRAIIMLQDSQLGQILQIQNNLISEWKQGDYYSWTGTTPHAIYNFSKQDRYAVQVTGFLNEIL